MLNRKTNSWVWVASFLFGWLLSLFACAHTRGSDSGILRCGGLERQYLPVRWVGRTTRDINGCDEIWAFFQSLK